MPDPMTISAILTALAPYIGAGTIGAGAAHAGTTEESVWYNPFTWGRKKKEDPLAGIRQQLISLAQTGLPMERIRGEIGRRFGERKITGLRDIGEETIAQRQVPGSIHTRLASDFLAKLAGEEESALLEADIAGRRFQMAGLQTAMGYPAPTGYEPGPLEELLPIATRFAGEEFGRRRLFEDIARLYPIEEEPLKEKGESVIG